MDVVGLTVGCEFDLLIFILIRLLQGYSIITTVRQGSSCSFHANRLQIWNVSGNCSGIFLGFGRYFGIMECVFMILTHHYSCC